MLLFVAHAEAADCAGALTVADFAPDASALVTAAGPCAFVVETRPSPSLWSWGGARYGADPAPDFELTLRWRRLTERGISALEVAFPGGSLLMRDDEFAWWENDARWTLQGWLPLAMDTSEVHHVRLVQRGRALAAWIDGVALPGFELLAPPQPGRLSIGLKGGRLDRARMWVEGVRLQQPSGATPSTSSR